MTTRDHRIRTFVARLIAAIAILTAWTPALAQRQGMELVDQANKGVARSGSLKAADPEWFPLIAAMDPPPSRLKSVDDASLLLPQTPGWEEAVAWATGEPQQAVLEKAREVMDYPARYRITLPYGTSGVDQAWIDAGLVVPLRDGLLATASFDYLKPLDRVSMLFSVEATRLADEGEGDKALDTLVAWYSMGRIVLEREFVEEKIWGARQMQNALERLRDVVYVYDYNFEPSQMTRVNEELEEREVQIDRLRMPQGDRLAAHQLVARTMAERGGVLEQYFTQTMGLLGAGEHPLQAFSEAAHWRDIAAVHAGQYDTDQQIDRLFGDWEKRLHIENLHDPLLERLTDYDLMDKRRFRLADVTMRRVADMMPMRLVLTADLRATRLCLGVAAFHMAQGVYPQALAAVSPKYISRIPFDPYNYLPDFERYDSFVYFVPIRDQFNDPGAPRKPHIVKVQEAEDEGAAAAAAAAITFDDFPYSAFDVEQGTVDSKRVREYYQRKYDSMSDSSMPIEEMTELLQDMIDAGVTPSNAGSNFAGELITADEAALLRGAGVDVGDYIDAIERSFRELAQTEAFKKAYETVKAGGELDAATVRQVLHGLNEVTNQDKFLRPIAQIAKASLEISRGQGVTGQDILRYLLQGSLAEFAFTAPEVVHPSFEVGVDDTTFILYSVGPDGAKNAAKIVGDDGKDILYWPSILSLKRQHEMDVARGLAE